MGKQYGTVTSTTTIDRDSHESIFMPVIPHDANGTVQCEVASSCVTGGELRYAVYRQSEYLRSALTDALVMPSARRPAVGLKLAVLVGVSKYTRRPRKRISDLEYADDDIVQWYTYLKRLGYECTVLGDEFSPWPCDVVVAPRPPATILSGMGREP